MNQHRQFKEIAPLWLEEKRSYVKVSTYTVYALPVVNHILPAFGDEYEITEPSVQKFILRKLDAGLSRKSVKDILVVLNMIVRFGAKKGYTAPD